MINMAVVHLNNENFVKEVEQSNIPVLIDFWAPWCGPCQMMGPVFEELSNDYAGKVKFAKLNTDEYPELAQKFGIMGIPTLIMTKDGQEIDRVVGFAPKEVLKQKIDSMVM